ncbi:MULTISPECIES: TRAP transporter substrate-binding protein DctP [Alphaproteobacteria]|uniref:TRAP transporter substrate-binding protein DctP n=1 Tax=Alphaproteobacteria TaxID=28211 RepID=UPI0030ED6DF6|tara:strand:+ start:40084 stop:41073 length:990 start_codon:yes stop_codon:yes gene_type:complete
MFLKKLSQTAAVAAMSISMMTGAAQALDLRIGWTTSDGEKDPYAIAAHSFVKELSAALGEDVTAQYFPNNQLGDEREMLEAMNFGVMDVAVITNAAIANIQPGFQLIDMPFLFGNEEQAHTILDGDIGQELMGRLEQNGIVGLGFAEGGFRNMINNVRPINEPNDVEGIKFRVMQNRAFIDMFQALGGNAIPLAWGETYTATQQGTIDGLEIPLAVIWANKYADVTDYLSLTKHTYSALGLLISEKRFNSFSDEQKQAVRDAATKAIASQRKQVAKNSTELIGLLKEAGMKINEVKDPAQFRSKVMSVYETFKPSIGEDLLDKALSELQ